MILVTGATGNVGRHVVSQLLEAGAPVRALARDPDSAGLPDGVDIVQGDLSEPDALDRCLEGVEAVFLLWALLTAEALPEILDAVSRHTRRIVYLSSMGIDDDLDRQADPINQSHADVEQLIERFGLEWTFVRSGGMATNTLWWAPDVRADGVVRSFHGAALRSLVHERDVAAVTVRALSADEHVGARYPVTGPQSLTQVEQMHAIGEAIGRQLRWEEIPPETGRQQMLADGTSPSLADGILNAHARFVTEPEPVTQTVLEVTGAPALTFGEWAADHAGAFERGER